MTNLENNNGYRRQRGNRQIWNIPQMSRIAINASSGTLPMHGSLLYANKHRRNTWQTKQRLKKLTNVAPRIGVFKFVGYCFLTLVLLPLFLFDARPRKTSKWQSPAE